MKTSGPVQEEGDPYLHTADERKAFVVVVLATFRFVAGEPTVPLRIY